MFPGMRTTEFVLAALLLAACGGGSAGPDGGGDDDVADATPPPPPGIAPGPTLLAAADPRLDGFDGWPLAFAVVSGSADMRCVVELSRAGTPLATLESPVAQDACAVVWPGVGAAGERLAPGTVDVTAKLMPAVGEALAQTTAVVEVVRLGIVDVSLDSADEAQLMYGALGGVSQGYWLLPTDRPGWRIGPDAAEGATAVRLELANGDPRPLPGPWDDLRSPPLDDTGPDPDGVEVDSYNLPAAFLAGALIDATATLSADVAGAAGGGAPQVAEVRVVAPAGSTIYEGGPFVHDGQVVVQAPALVPAVGRYDHSLRWTFEARAPGGEWAPVPGGVTTRHIVYGLAGLPIFDYSSMAHHAWVEVVDMVTRWIDGGTADPNAVAAAIVTGVYFELALVYDTQNGASAYTWYPGFGWENSQFDLSAFLVRENGDTINCSDAASLVSTFANMVGVDIRYHILQRGDGMGFDLNYIRAIGQPVFDETPFIGDRGRFSYHAVVGPPDGTFYDGTLQLDGDGTPTAPPHVPLLAAGMVAVDYLIALSSEWDIVDTSMDEKVELR